MIYWLFFTFACLLLISLSLYLSIQHLQEIIPRGRKKKERERVFGKTLRNVIYVCKKGESFLHCPRALTAKTEGQEARTAENSFLNSLHEALEAV